MSNLNICGEEWQDSIGDEQIIWNEMILKQNISVKRKIFLRNNMVSNFIKLLNLIN